MPFSLYPIVSILKAALVDLEKIANKDVIIVLGNTGCGKSTMLNSLLLGPDSIEEQTIKEQIGTTKKFKPRKVLAQKNPQMTLKIGHSKNESETFFPHFVWKESAQ